MCLYMPTEALKGAVPAEEAIPEEGEEEGEVSELK